MRQGISCRGRIGERSVIRIPRPRTTCQYTILLERSLVALDCYCSAARYSRNQARSRSKYLELPFDSPCDRLMTSESPNRATQWRGIRKAAFNRCLTDAPGFLYQLSFPLSWKEAHQFSAHDSTITSPRSGPMQRRLAASRGRFFSVDTTVWNGLSGQAAALRRTRQTR